MHWISNLIIAVLLTSTSVSNSRTCQSFKLGLTCDFHFIYESLSQFQLALINAQICKHFQTVLTHFPSTSLKFVSARPCVFPSSYSPLQSALIYNHTLDRFDIFWGAHIFIIKHSHTRAFFHSLTHLFSFGGGFAFSHFFAGILS